MLNFNQDQVRNAKIALETFALCRGATRTELDESRAKMGDESRLTDHRRRVSTRLGVKYSRVQWGLASVLEECATICSALAGYTGDWKQLRADAWAVVKGATA